MCHVRNIELKKVEERQLTEDSVARKMEAFQLNTKKGKQHKCDKNKQQKDTQLHGT